jgi:serine/threonine protein kinase
MQSSSTNILTQINHGDEKTPHSETPADATLLSEQEMHMGMRTFKIHSYDLDAIKRDYSVLNKYPSHFVTTYIRSNQTDFRIDFQNTIANFDYAKYSLENKHSIILRIANALSLCHKHGVFYGKLSPNFVISDAEGNCNSARLIPISLRWYTSAPYTSRLQLQTQYCSDYSVCYLAPEMMGPINTCDIRLMLSSPNVPSLTNLPVGITRSAYVLYGSGTTPTELYFIDDRYFTNFRYRERYIKKITAFAENHSLNTFISAFFKDNNLKELYRLTPEQIQTAKLITSPRLFSFPIYTLIQQQQTEKSDVYTLGRFMFRMRYGIDPWAVERFTREEVKQALAKGEHPSPLSFVKQASATTVATTATTVFAASAKQPLKELSLERKRIVALGDLLEQLMLDCCEYNADKRPALKDVIARLEKMPDEVMIATETASTAVSAPKCGPK